MPGYEGYEVNVRGEVRSWIAWRGRPVPHEIHPKTDPNGYRIMCLSGRRYVRVHTLVLLAFRGPCPEGMEARHLDGNPANNELGNIVWSTHGENECDKVRHGRASGKWGYGQPHPGGKLTMADVLEIRRLTSEGWKQKAIAERFGIVRHSVFNAVHGCCRWSDRVCKRRVG